MYMHYKKRFSTPKRARIIYDKRCIIYISPQMIAMSVLGAFFLFSVFSRRHSHSFFEVAA